MLSLQGAGFPGPSLLERLDASAVAAVRGGALVAWASAEGLRALAESESIARVLDRGGMHLLIGTDAVTNLRSLHTLKHMQHRYPALTAAFMVHANRALFHPKLFWFQHADGSGCIVVGSGNLTRAGLTTNWEASAVLDATVDEMAAFHERVEAFTAQHADLLFTVDDDEVQARVSLNRVVRARLPEAMVAEERVAETADPTADPTVAGPPRSDWLITELSKSRKDAQGRSLFSQSSFPLQIARDFFGWAGANRDVDLVSIDGESGDPLDTRLTTIRFKPNSTNAYFELAAVQGMPYPDIGNPIAVFHRLGPALFEYLVSVPGGPHHETLEAIIDRHAVGFMPGLKVRVMLDDVSVRQDWPGAPFRGFTEGS